MTIQLPPDVEAIVKAKVASGAFANESDVLAAAVRVFEREDSERESQKARLRGMLQDAIEQVERGEVFDVDEAFDEVETELFGKKLAIRRA